MTQYADYIQTEPGGTKYFCRDLEAQADLAGLGSLASKNQASLTADVSGVLPIANGGAGTGLNKNKIFGGRNLGTSYTAAQKASIANGTFDGMFLGDYWSINSVTWRIAGFNYYINKGDAACSTNHLLIFPDENLLSADGSTTHYMNDTNTTEGGYKATKLRSTYLSQCLSKVQAAFGSGNILSHKELISNAISSGEASGWEWVSTQIEIPSEVQIYGSSIWGSSTITTGGTGCNIGTAYPMFPLFAVAPQYAINRSQSYWLRDVVSASYFAYVDYLGTAHVTVASHAWLGVRPFFLLS